MGQMTRKVINTAAGSTVEMVAAVSGKTIKVYDCFFALATATTVDIKSATTTLTGVMTLAASVIHHIGPIAIDPGDPVSSKAVPVLVCASGEALNFAFGGAVQTSGSLIYTQE